MRLIFTTIAALIFGSAFWDVGRKRDSIQSLMMVMGALYSACLFLGVNNASSVQPIVSIERTVFYREKAAGMYSPFAYAAAQVIPSTRTLRLFRKLNFWKSRVHNSPLPSTVMQGLIEIPYIAVQTIVYGVITYFMVNFERTISKLFSSSIGIELIVNHSIISSLIFLSLLQQNSCSIFCSCSSHLPTSPFMAWRLLDSLLLNT